jgi:hypothetical protein
VVLNGKGAALPENLIRIACSSRCLHASIAAGRVSERHPIAVIPPVAGLPGKRAA